MTQALRVSVLIACYNEEKTLKRSIETLLAQSRKPDEIVIVDDGSTDGTREILESFGAEIKPVFLPKNTGNKSYAQEAGLKEVTGDIFITTDADTLLHTDFIREMSKAFEDPEVHAAAGYIISIRNNWITASRELDYVMGQDVYKSGQAHLRAVHVIPGAAGAFRTATFKKHVKFDHDTLTEDLDFTYQLHEGGYRIAFVKSAVVYTQDPSSIPAYVKQERRWMGGSWQNFLKHYKVILRKPALLLEIGLIYLDGFLSLGFIMFLLLGHIMALGLYVLAYLTSAALLGIYAALRRGNWRLFAVFPAYVFVMFLNLYVFIEQFFLEVIFQKRNLVWYKPERNLLK